MPHHVIFSEFISLQFTVIWSERWCDTKVAGSIPWFGIKLLPQRMQMYKRCRTFCKEFPGVLVDCEILISDTYAYIRSKRACWLHAQKKKRNPSNLHKQLARKVPRVLKLNKESLKSEWGKTVNGYSSLANSLLLLAKHLVCLWAAKGD